ncbi:MAG: Fe-S cluster assembly protein SufD, partial [Akkermansiaceae bacterium]
CEANSMPGLEINADDVKCSHGSTAARVSDEEIFYLQARGINARDARTLVAKGFSIEAIEKLQDETLEALALEVVERKFATVE